MELKWKKPAPTEIALILLSAVLLLGVLTVFAPCAPKEDGTWMHCHASGTVVAALAAAVLALSLLRLPFGRRTRAVLDALSIVLAALAAATPGQLVQLCMMPDMRCRRLTAPFSCVLGLLILLAAAIDLALRLRKERRW